MPEPWRRVVYSEVSAPLCLNSSTRHSNPSAARQHNSLRLSESSLGPGGPGGAEPALAQVKRPRHQPLSGFTAVLALRLGPETRIRKTGPCLGPAARRRRHGYIHTQGLPRARTCTPSGVQDGPAPFVSVVRGCRGRRVEGLARAHTHRETTPLRASQWSGGVPNNPHPHARAHTHTYTRRTHARTHARRSLQSCMLNTFPVAYRPVN